MATSMTEAPQVLNQNGEPAGNDLAPEPMDVQPSEQEQGVQITFQIIYGKHKEDITLHDLTKVVHLRAVIQERTRIRPEGQKLLMKGVPLKDDSATLRQAGVKTGVKLMLIGTPEPEVAAAAVAPEAAAAATSSTADWDSDQPTNEPICKQTAHAKVLAKGKPEDAEPGVAGRQVTMPDTLVRLGGMCNSHGTRIRLTMKEDTRELWIGSAERTQKMPYSSIHKIEAFPIDDSPEYSIICLHLGSGKFWIYWFPSQYVAGLKIRIIGVQALL